MQIRNLAVLAVLAAAPLSAQGKFGIVVGGVSSNLKFSEDQIVDPGSRMGFAAGISMGGGAGKISFSPEALYVMKGSETEVGDVKSGIKLTYIEVPLLFKASLGSSSMKPFVTFGPSVAYNLGCKNFEGDESEDCAEEGDETSGVEKLDYGIMVGAGLNFGKIGVSVRYDMGMANLSKAEGDFSVKNKALMVLANIRF